MYLVQEINGSTYVQVEKLWEMEKERLIDTEAAVNDYNITL